MGELYPGYGSFSLKAAKGTCISSPPKVVSLSEGANVKGWSLSWDGGERETRKQKPGRFAMIPA